MNEKQTLKMIIETPKTLSDEQKKAVLSGKRYVRIIAGAGTGKTETLTRRIAYLIKRHKTFRGGKYVSYFVYAKHYFNGNLVSISYIRYSL